jgi:hypothetical protein
VNPKDFLLAFLLLAAYCILLTAYSCIEPGLSLRHFASNEVEVGEFS